MAGWLAVLARKRTPPDAQRWADAVRAARRYGDAVEEHVAPGVLLAAWRRQAGEFPCSGKCLPFNGGRIAWVGQCVDDNGETTRDTLGVLAQQNPRDSDVATVNGSFAAAVASLQGDTPVLTVWTDRFRHYPVYMYRADDCVAVSTEMRCLVPFIQRPAFNIAAIDLLLRCEELIDRMTILAGVDMLPGAVRVTIDDDGVREHRYWRMQFRPDRTSSHQCYAAGIAKAMTTAVRRIEACTDRLGVPLSGGLDSRLLLGLCNDPHRVPSLTWGVPQCRDVQYATAFARRVGSPHRLCFWRPEDFLHLWPEGVDRTAGGFGIHHMFALPFAGALGECCEVVLNGLAGDVLLGGNFLKQAWIRERDLRALASASWRWRVRPDQEQWADRLLRMPAGGSTACRLWTDSIAAEDDCRPIDRLNQWLFGNRMFRFTNCGTMLLRRAVESHSPFFDRDVMDLLLRVPMEMKWKHRLYLRVIDCACPAAGRVPWQRTAIPPAWGFPPNFCAMAFHRALRSICKPFGVEPFPGQAMADVGGWLRHDWRHAVEAILLSDQSLDRGLFCPDALRALWRAHQQGADCTRLLGGAIAVELFARTNLAANREAPGAELLWANP